jgi:hypothetical protein
MEGSDGPVSSRTESLTRVVITLEKAGVDFLDGDQPGVRMRAVPVKATPPAAKH